MRQSRLRSLWASNAPIVLLAGLLALGVSMLLLGVLAAEGSTTPLHASRVDARNGSVLLSYGIPPYAPVDSVLEASYAFPEAPGDVLVLHCADLDRMARGEPPQAPALLREGQREGAFARPMEGYLGFGTFYFSAGPAPSASGAGGSQVGVSAEGATCAGAYVTFRWSGDDPQRNRPVATVQVREVPLDSRTAGVLFAFAALGGLLALAGGLEWGRRRAARAAGTDEGAGTAETLYRLAQRSEAWLLRTRRYVLLSGALGVFLWYPVLVPWAWRTGRDASGAPWMPWTLAGGALLLLAGLTTLWAREFLRLDRELRAWREQVAELRRREERLMAELAP